jgi:hypothetical protein
MTYTESNHSLVSSTLKKYFREAGLQVPPDTFEKIVDEICDDDDSKVNLNATTKGDFIAQKALTLLGQMNHE